MFLYVGLWMGNIWKLWLSGDRLSSGLPPRGSLLWLPHEVNSLLFCVSHHPYYQFLRPCDYLFSICFLKRLWFSWGQGWWSASPLVVFPEPNTGLPDRCFINIWGVFLQWISQEKKIRNGLWGLWWGCGSFFFFSSSNDSAEGILLIFHGRPQLRMGWTRGAWMA